MPSRLKSSLSLAQLHDVAPTEYALADFEVSHSSHKSKSKVSGTSAGVASNDEADVDMDSDDGEEEDGEVEDRRGHYIYVGPSARRRKANLTEVQDGMLDSGKYRGEAARWKDLAGDGEEIGSDEDDVESDEDGDEDEDDLSGSSGSDIEEGDETGSTSGSEEEQSSRPRKRKSVRFDAPDSDDTSYPRRSKSGAATIASSLSRQDELMSSLRSQAQEDALQGKAIKSQLASWQRALEVRIKLEKVAGGRGIGRIHPAATSALLAQSDDATKDAYDGLTGALLGHSAALLQAQAQLLASTEAAATSSRVEDDEEDGVQDDLRDFQKEVAEVATATADAARSKRKRSEDDSDGTDEDSIEALHQQQLSLALRFGSRILEPFMKTTLDRHSLLRSNGDREGAASSANKFSGGLKALDQSILRQVEVAMSGEGGKRLVERTRKWRGEGERIGASAGAAKKPKLDGDAEDADAGAQEKDDAETFDDSDFYSSLLRSLIESSASGSGASTQPAGAGEPPLQFTQFHPRTNTKQRGIDTRASKGRKLRFEVMEKVANFMPRIVNRERWTQEMKDRLFAVLPGRPGADEEQGSDDEDEDEERRKETAEAGLGGIKLFG